MLNYEERSRKFANKVFSLKKMTLPVDIEQVIKEYADVEEDIIPYEGDAICLNHKSKPLIVLRKNVPVTRKRFTLAHELGHILVPWHTGMISCHTDDKCEKIDIGKYYRMETEANVFAAELLMPQAWIKELVASSYDLEKLINIICEKAQVSFLAALYNLINVLPSGYILFIRNNYSDFMTKKMSEDIDTPILLSNAHITYDLEWISYNSDQSGCIEREVYTVFWFKLKEVLDQKVIVDRIDQLLEKNNIYHILNNIIDHKEFCCVAYALNTLVENLPPGYILKISFLPTGTYKYLRTKETYVNHMGALEDIDTWYAEYCQESGEYRDGDIQINWWYFKTVFNFHPISATQESKTMIKGIVGKIYSLDERKSILGIINGFIGSLNNRRDEMEPEKFYSILRQKFLGKEELNDIIAHDDFNDFLIIKTQELYKIKK